MIDNSSHMEENEEAKAKVPDSHNQMIRECGNFLSDKEESSAFNFNAQNKIVESESTYE